MSEQDDGCFCGQCEECEAHRNAHLGSPASLVPEGTPPNRKPWWFSFGRMMDPMMEFLVARAGARRCTSVHLDGYRCERASGHDGEHAAFLADDDEYGKIPTLTWPAAMRGVRVSEIPVANDYRATVYTTDDEHVVSLWRDGQTFDIRVPRSRETR